MPYQHLTIRMLAERALPHNLHFDYHVIIKVKGHQYRWLAGG